MVAYTYINGAYIEAKWDPDRQAFVFPTLTYRTWGN